MENILKMLLEYSELCALNVALRAHGGRGMDKEQREMKIKIEKHIEDWSKRWVL